MPKKYGDLARRMKDYERPFRHKLVPNSPLMIRVDGRAFHTYTNYMPKPFSSDIMDAMDHSAWMTAREIQGFKLAYCQSDECTFYATDYDSFDTQGWFDYDLNKVVSITASLFTCHFNAYMDIADPPGTNGRAVFDARAWTMPHDEVPNNFVWRQQDWQRNSVQMLAQSVFNHKELNGKSVRDQLVMLEEAGQPWEKRSDREKYGLFISRSYEKISRPLAYSDIASIIGDIPA